MIGSIDCMHWTWQNCPVAWYGVYKGKPKKATVILEAVASKNLWIWHAFFGVPGSNNDLNVLDRSPVLDGIMNGQAPTAEFTVNDRVYTTAYYLTDGIYPPWTVFQLTIAKLQTPERKLYAKMQESCRKNVERAFGVLKQRFCVLAISCKLWHAKAMGDVMLACIILHNMIIEDERLVPDLDNRYLYDDDWCCPIDTHTPIENAASRVAAFLSRVEDKYAHFRLRDDLIQNIWRHYKDKEVDL